MFRERDLTLSLNKQALWLYSAPTDEAEAH